MGIEYCLYKPKTKERYELGKGKWSEVFDFYTHKLNIDDNFYNFYEKILGKIAITFHPDTKLSYFCWLAIDIWNWCGNDEVELWTEELFYDKYFDSNYMDWNKFLKAHSYTGTRYKK